MKNPHRLIASRCLRCQCTIRRAAHELRLRCPAHRGRRPHREVLRHSRGDQNGKSTSAGLWLCFKMSLQLYFGHRPCHLEIASPLLTCLFTKVPQDTGGTNTTNNTQVCIWDCCDEKGMYAVVTSYELLSVF